MQNFSRKKQVFCGKNTLITNINNTYFSSFKVLDYSSAPTATSVAVDELILKKVANDLDFTLGKLNGCNKYIR